MRLVKAFALVLCVSLAFVACESKSEKATDSKVAVAAQMETVSLSISGMTCEIGCAKTIQSKLSKKEGINKAKVVFVDSLATVNFDANKISKAEIITFIDGIAGGNMYKATEVDKK